MHLDTAPAFSLFIVLHLCLSLTLGPVNDGAQQSCTSLRYQKGNGAYCITPLFIPKRVCVCVCWANVGTHHSWKQSAHIHRENMHMHTEKKWNSR